MDSSVKSVCFDEIAHTVLDADKKITVKTISNNWDITINNAATVLEEWISKNGQHNLIKEYLVKGTDKNGNGVITIVPNTKLDIIQRKLLHFTKILHSIELASESCIKKLVVPEYDEIKMINLNLNSEERDFDSVPPIEKNEMSAAKSQSKIQPVVVKKKEVSISTMFSSSSKSDKKSKSDNDSEESKIDSSPVQLEKSAASAIKEPRTPKKSEEAVKPTPKESPKSKKDIKKTTPKNSIASFFIQAGSKPKPASTVAATSKPDSPKLIKSEVKTPESAKKPVPVKKSESTKKIESSKKAEPVIEKKSPEKVSSKTVTTKMATPKKKETKTDTLKRSISAICDSDDTDDDIIPTTPQAKKQPKPKRTNSKQTGNAKKRTRIIQNDSSDEDSSDVKTNGKSSDIENMEVIQESPKNKSSNKRTQNVENSNGKKRKAKRTVTRTYEDSDGFFKTVKEVEEYSCSDDDVQIEPIKSLNKPINKNDKASAKDTKKSPTKQTPSKKNDKPATKQGSIMSFFSKK